MGRPRTGEYTELVCPRCGKTGTLTKKGMRTIGNVRKQAYLCNSCHIQTVRPLKTVSTTV